MYLEFFEETYRNEGEEFCAVCQRGNDMCQEAIEERATDAKVDAEWLAEMIYLDKLPMQPEEEDIYELAVQDEKSKLPSVDKDYVYHKVYDGLSGMLSTFDLSDIIDNVNLERREAEWAKKYLEIVLMVNSE